jgi:hypothetical protein
MSESSGSSYVGVAGETKTEPDFFTGKMTIEQMRYYLQEYHGVPIALREQGATDVTCPFCHKQHFEHPGAGHHVAQCEPSEWSPVTINGKSFVAGYGYTIYEYYDTPNARKLNVAPNLDPPTEAPMAAPAQAPTPVWTPKQAPMPVWTEMQRAFNGL